MGGRPALARYLLDHPGCVRGRAVLDLASGSGLVAIAAAAAGAASVTPSETDSLAAAAITLNAGVNRVRLEPTVGDLLAAPVPPPARVRPGCTWGLGTCGLGTCGLRACGLRTWSWLATPSTTGTWPA